MRIRLDDDIVDSYRSSMDIVLKPHRDYKCEVLSYMEELSAKMDEVIEKTTKEGE